MIKLSRTPYRLVRSTNHVNDYTIAKSRIITNSHSFKLEDVNASVAGVLTNGKKHLMFHSIPELQSLSSIKRELAAKIELLRETSDKITGFICGGLELNKSNKASADSFNLYNKIADSLDEFNIPFTMMCGKEKGACPDNLYSNANAVLVWNNDFKDMFKNTKNLSQDEIVSMLENRYQFVERNSSQEFKICDSPTKVYNG